MNPLNNRFALCSLVGALTLTSVAPGCQKKEDVVIVENGFLSGAEDNFPRFTVYGFPTSTLKDDAYNVTSLMNIEGKEVMTEFRGVYFSNRDAYVLISSEVGSSNGQGIKMTGFYTDNRFYIERLEVKGYVVSSARDRNKPYHLEATEDKDPRNK